MAVRILIGDCREMLRTLPGESVHCVVTSPPYWGLRDYGVAGQLGMEPTYIEHIKTMADVFDEVRRVLRSDGTLWLNYGDSYATSVNGRSAADTKATGNDDRTFRDKPFSTIQGVLKPKDLCGIPWRVAFALQERGWWLRQDIIWSKPNPMPESIRDRCTKAHEYLFLLSKSERYYYDAEAIAEASLTGDVARPRGSMGANALDGRGRGAQGIGKPPRDTDCSVRNKRSVWEIATAPYSEAHFATFPPALIEPCILAGCPERCCPACGAPWVREVERGETLNRTAVNGQGNGQLNKSGRFGDSQKITLGFSPSCECYAPMHSPGIVLDPFGGAGTTGLVADRLKRDALLIELNPEYAAMAKRRIEGDAPLFANVEKHEADQLMFGA